MVAAQRAYNADPHRRFSYTKIVPPILLTLLGCTSETEAESCEGSTLIVSGTVYDLSSNPFVGANVLARSTVLRFQYWRPGTGAECAYEEYISCPKIEVVRYISRVAWSRIRISSDVPSATETMAGIGDGRSIGLHRGWETNAERLHVRLYE